MLALALKWWPQILMAIVVAAALAYVETLRLEVSHYKATSIAATAKYNTEYMQHTADVATWNAEVVRVTASNDKLAGLFNKVVDDANQKYTVLSKTVVDQQKERQNVITTIVTPTETVDLPSSFRSLYNSAVGGADLASRSGEDQGKAKADTISTTDSRETLNALSFTRVIIGNVDEYTNLATRCNTLIDIVKGTQNDPNGTDGPASAGRGDAVSGPVKTN